MHSPYARNKTNQRNETPKKPNKKNPGIADLLAEEPPDASAAAGFSSLFFAADRSGYRSLDALAGSTAKKLLSSELKSKKKKKKRAARRERSKWGRHRDLPACSSLEASIAVFEVLIEQRGGCRGWGKWLERAYL